MRRRFRSFCSQGFGFLPGGPEALGPVRELCSRRAPSGGEGSRVQGRPALRGTSRTGTNASRHFKLLSPLLQLDRGLVACRLVSERTPRVANVDQRIRRGGRCKSEPEEGHVTGKVFDGCRGARAPTPRDIGQPGKRPSEHSRRKPSRSHGPTTPAGWLSQQRPDFKGSTRNTW